MAYENNNSINKRVLVTGGAGFIGSHVTQALGERGLEIIVADNFSTGSTNNITRDLIVEDMDITDASRVNEIFERYKPQAVVHLAAYINLPESVREPKIDADNNIMGTINVMKASLENSAGKFVFASSAAVYGVPQSYPVCEDHPTNPESPYGISKLAGERYLQVLARDLRPVILRFTNVYGPRQNLDGKGEGGVVSIFLDSIKNGKSPTLRGDGKPVRDYAYVADIARAVSKSLDSDAGIYNLGTGVGLTVEDVWSAIAGEYGRMGSAVPEPNYGPLKEGEVMKMILSVDKAKLHLGWSAVTDFNEGIKATVQYFSGEKKAA
jgi:UDP-glucose 4-epimerase